MSDITNTAKIKMFFSQFITVLTVLLLLLSPYQYVFGQELTTESVSSEASFSSSETYISGPISMDMLQEALTDHTQADIADILKKTYDLNNKEHGSIKRAKTEDALLDAINLALGGEEVSSTGPEVQALSSTGSGAVDPVVSSLVNGTDASQRLRVEANQHTGAAGYSYPFEVPQWIGGLNPGVSVGYSSENQLNDSIVGYGWSLDLPMISSRNITGLDTIYTSDDYQSSLHGNLKEVLPNIYQAQYDDGSYATYTKSGNTWTLTTKSGYIFNFGTTAASRKDNSANSAEIFTWYVDSISDSNGNTINYTYFKNDGQIYPDTITYGPYTVQFNRQSRSDDLVSYTPGFYTKTNYRIHEVLVKFNGTNIRKYDITYTVGDNDNRSMLQSIQETGYNSAITNVLPATTFTYSEHSRQWVGTPDNYTVGGSSSYNFLGIDSSAPVDLNGDGWTDWIRSEDIADGVINPTEHRAIHNTNNTIAPDLSPANPLPVPTYISGGYWLYCGSTQRRVGSVFTDLNGDRQYDVLDSQDYDTMYCGGNGYYFDNASGYLGGQNGAWTNNTAYSPSLTFNVPNGSYYWFVRDVNTDGLPDFLYNDPNIGSIPNGATTHPAAVQINNGAGFNPVNNTDWDFPVYYSGNGTPRRVSGRESSIADYNGDGVTDILTSWGTIQNGNALYFGNGRGTWQEDATAWNNFKVGAGEPSSTEYNIPQVDINGDGLIDFYNNKSISWAGPIGVFINTGETFTSTHSDYTLSALSAFDPGNSNHPYVDINADGLMDRLVQSGNNGEVDANIAQGMVPDHLISISHSTGATTDITYKPSTHYKDTNGDLLNPDLPMIVQTVNTITTNDNNGNVSTTTYEYADGHYFYKDAFDRRFAGFGKVTTTDALGQDTVTYYHQGNGQQGSEPSDPTDGSKIGKVYQTERKTSGGTIMATSDTTWASTSLGNNRYFVVPTQTVATEDGKTTTTTRVYNTSTGNLTSETTSFNDGQSYTDSTANYTYTSGSLVLPATVTVQNGGSDWAKSRTYYDNQSLGLTNGNGNVTKTEIWDGTNWIDSTYTHDSYGNVLTETDPENNTTTYAYDTYNLYPATITNDLSQTTTFVYNYGVAQPSSITDANSNTTTTTYDGLGRVLSVTTPKGLTQTASYNDASSPLSVTTNAYLDATNAVQSIQYMDGLGRTIQTKAEAEAGQWSTTDTVYDLLGRVASQSLPYFSGSNASTAPTTNTNLYTTTVYDTLSRPVTISDTTGTITNTYAAWVTTVNDKNSVNKTLTTDGAGNLIQVIENNGGAQYTTNYTYDPIGNLTQITDAENNRRTFTYDKLGRRLTATDLYANGDTTYGVHTYTYDDNGNVLTHNTPNGDTITYTYDDLNRLLTEDSSSLSGIEWSYTYDQGPNEIGQISRVASANDATVINYDYDTMGNITSEKKDFDGVLYVTDTTYDRQGNPLTITYPYGVTSVTYTYNNAGLLETITEGSNTIVSDFDYNALGMITEQVNGNGTTTTNTYDLNELYRLKQKLTDTTQSQASAATSPWYQFLLPKTAQAEGEIYPIILESETEPLEGRPDFGPDAATATTETTLEASFSTIESDNMVISTKVQPEPTSAEEKAFNKAFKRAQKQMEREHQKMQESPFTKQQQKELQKLHDQATNGETAETLSWFDRLLPVAHAAGATPPDAPQNLEAGTWWQTENMLSNYSFENGAADWLYYGTSGTTMTTDCTTATDGSCSFKVDPVAGSNWWDTMLYRELRYDQDTNYKFVFDAKADSNQTITIYAGQNHSPWAALGLSTTVDLTTSWTTYELDFTSWDTDEVSRILFGLGTNTDTMWFDNVRLIPDKENMIANPSFENGGTDWYTWSNNGGSGTISYSQNSIGNASYQINVPTAGQNWETQLMQGIAVDSNLTYTLTFDARSDATRSNKVHFAENHSPYNDLTPKLNFDTTTTWQSYTFEMTPWSTDSDAKLAFSVGEATPTLYLDNIKLVVKNDYTITDATPDFTGIFDDPDSPENATSYQIQINTSSDFTSPLYDSGKTTLSPNVTEGDRSQVLQPLTITLDGSTYYWRMKFWDGLDTEGAWSNGYNYFVTSNQTPPPSGAIQDLTYTYDANGNVLSITDASGTNAAKVSTFGYDDLNRLTSATITNSANNADYTRTYSYSPTGNILTANGETYTYSQPGKTNPQAVTSVNGTSYTYDDNGNVLTSGTNSYTWNYKNQLVSSVSGNTSYYYYDHNGQRIIHQGSTYYHTPNQFYRASGPNQTKYIYAGSTLIATIEDNWSTQTTHYNHGDHLGSSSVTTDASGAIEQVIDYYAFGDQRLNDTTSFDSVHKFTNHQYDDDTDLTYMKARYYSDSARRFMSQDPVSLYNPEKFLSDPQKMNFYSYARNNPLAYVDPNGEEPISLTVLLVLGAAGLIGGGINAGATIGINRAFGEQTQWQDAAGAFASGAYDGMVTVATVGLSQTPLARNFSGLISGNIESGVSQGLKMLTEPGYEFDAMEHAITVGINTASGSIPVADQLLKRAGLDKAAKYLSKSGLEATVGQALINSAAKNGFTPGGAELLISTGGLMFAEESAAIVFENTASNVSGGIQSFYQAPNLPSYDGPAYLGTYETPRQTFIGPSQ